MQKIILASHSPRRKQILSLANVPFIVNSVETHESYPLTLPPEQVAIHIARNKALAVSTAATRENEEVAVRFFPIVAADTIVVLDKEIIGKPADKKDAVKILQKLSGKKHLVISGVVILYNNTEVNFATTTEVEFYELTAQQIDYYVDYHKPFDKAGAYAIQEWIGAVGIKKINGDFYNVMGLPVSRLLIELQKIEGG